MSNKTIHTSQIFLTILLVIMVASAHCYSKDVQFEHINNDNGLPVNSVVSIEQDQYGYMWFGSMNGLVRYDGYNYKHFTHSASNLKSLPGNLITNITSTHQGKLYLIPNGNGICSYNYEKEQFTNYQPSDTCNIPSENVNDMKQDHLGNFWLGTDNGLSYFDTKNNQFTNYSIKDITQSLNIHPDFTERISYIAIDKKDNLYLLTYQSTLLYFNIKTKQITHIKYSNQKQESVMLFSSGSLFVDSKNMLWVGTEDNGIYIYNPEKPDDSKHIIPDRIISTINEIDDLIWVGTDGDGLYILNKQGEILQHHVIDPFSLNSISSNCVYAIKQSSDKTIWLGNYANGLNTYNVFRHKFTSYNTIGKSGYRLSNKSIMCLTALNDSILLIGTDGGGINQLSTKDKKVKHLKSNDNLLDRLVAKTIIQWDDRTFYIGSYSKGLFHATMLDNGSVQAKSIFRTEVGYYKNIWGLYKLNDTSIWIGYLNAGLSIYNPKSGTYKDVEELHLHNIYSIKEINNKLWVSSEEEGVYVMDKQGNIINHYRNNPKIKGSISSNFIYSIFKDSKNRIWLGTSTGGLNLLVNEVSGQFKAYNAQNGFPANMITNIEEDENGLLWITSDRGLIRFNPEDKTYSLFDKKDGLQGQRFTYAASYNYKNNTLFFGGSDGLSFFNPSQIKQNPFITRVGITGLLIDNKKVEINQLVNGKVLLNKPLSLTEKLSLTYKQNDFTIEFAALHYESSERNKYKYKLEGFDKDWITCMPGQHSAHYTNLFKGNYTFKVKAANVDKVWNQNPATLKISIQPPFYRTIGFYVLFAILIALIIYSYVQFRTIKLKHDKAKLSRLVELKTFELREKAETVNQYNEEISTINEQLKAYNKTRDKIYSIIAHDLKNPLNALISFSTLMDTDGDSCTDEEKKEYIKIIRKTSTQMNSLILNLLYWVNNQSDAIKARPQILNVETIFEEAIELLKANAIQKEITLKQNHNSCSVYADADMLVTIIRNVIANSIKFSPTGGKIDIEATIKDNKTLITIVDNGCGMSKEQLQKINSQDDLYSTKGTANESGTGLGLVLCRDFTKKNRGRMIIDSLPNVGTTITIELPSS